MLICIGSNYPQGCLVLGLTVLWTWSGRFSALTDQSNEDLNYEAVSFILGISGQEENLDGIEGIKRSSCPTNRVLHGPKNKT